MTETSLKTKILAGVIALSIVGLISLYVLEFHWFGNTFEVKKLILFSLGLGFLVGVSLGQIFTKKIKDGYDRMRVSLMIVFACTLFSPLFGSLTNRLLAVQPYENQVFSFFQEKRVADFQIIDEDPGKPKGYFIFFMKEGQLERVKSSESLFKGIEKGAQIILPVKKGLWGFEIVCLQ